MLLISHRGSTKAFKTCLISQHQSWISINSLNDTLFCVVKIQMARNWMKLVECGRKEGAEELNAFFVPLSPNISKFVLLFSSALSLIPRRLLHYFFQVQCLLTILLWPTRIDMYEHLATARRPDYVRLLLQFNILNKFLNIIYL